MHHHRAPRTDSLRSCLKAPTPTPFRRSSSWNERCGNPTERMLSRSWTATGRRYPPGGRSWTQSTRSRRFHLRCMSCHPALISLSHTHLLWRHAWRLVVAASRYVLLYVGNHVLQHLNYQVDNPAVVLTQKVESFDGPLCSVLALRGARNPALMGENFSGIRRPRSF